MQYGFIKQGIVSAPLESVVGELQRIIARDGGVEPKTLVEESRPEEAPLHDEFEWDDSEAAERYREEQARKIIRAVVLVPEPPKERTLPVRAYFSVPEPTDENKQHRIYRPTTEILTDPAAAEAVQRRLLHELLNLQQRYQAYLQMDEELNNLLNNMVVRIQ